MLRIILIITISLSAWSALAHGDHDQPINLGEIEAFQQEFFKVIEAAPAYENSEHRLFQLIDGDHKYFESQFLRLVELSLEALPQPTADNCHHDSCGQKDKWYKKIKIKVQGFLQELRSSESKRQEIISHMREFKNYLRAIGYEYGTTVMVGLFITEILEHSLTGPFGLCPVVQAIYLSQVDKIKSAATVFTHSLRWKLGLSQAVKNAWQTTLMFHQQLRGSRKNIEVRLSSGLRFSTDRIYAQGLPHAHGQVSEELFRHNTLWLSHYRKNALAKLQSNSASASSDTSFLSTIRLFDYPSDAPTSGRRTSLLNSLHKKLFANDSRDQRGLFAVFTDLDYIFDGLHNSKSRFLVATSVAESLLLYSKLELLKITEQHRNNEISVDEFNQKSKTAAKLRAYIHNFHSFLTTASLLSSSLADNDDKLYVAYVALAKVLLSLKDLDQAEGHMQFKPWSCNAVLKS